jgi:hypothetical protein
MPAVRGVPPVDDVSPGGDAMTRWSSAVILGLAALTCVAATLMALSLGELQRVQALADRLSRDRVRVCTALSVVSGIRLSEYRSAEDHVAALAALNDAAVWCGGRPVSDKYLEEAVR